MQAVFGGLVSDLSQRLRLVREAFGGPSARKLSQDLGVSANSWGVWESGQSLPGAAALQALCERGIDINWVLTGAGTMQREAKGLTVLAQQLQHVKSAQLGLAELALAARTSRWKRRIALLACLADIFPQALSVEELMNRLGMEEEDLLATLMTLLPMGRIFRVDGQEPKYQAVSSEFGGWETEADDRSEMVLDILKFIVSDALPLAVTKESERAVVFDSRICVHDGPAFLKSILSHIKTEASGPHATDGGENVRLVLAATVK